VRQAMYHAIDIDAVLRPLMGELLIPAGMVIAPGVNGYAPELAQRLPYDPERAKSLLVQAGYPGGFSVTLDCPKEWGDDDITTCRGVAEQLGAVGIEVAVAFHTQDAYEKRS
jgi:peptide/nickel transport system substrate-binding protein